MGKNWLNIIINHTSSSSSSSCLSRTPSALMISQILTFLSTLQTETAVSPSMYLPNIVSLSPVIILLCWTRQPGKGDLFVSGWHQTASTILHILTASHVCLVMAFKNILEKIILNFILIFKSLLLHWKPAQG